MYMYMFFCPAPLLAVAVGDWLGLVLCWQGEALLGSYVSISSSKAKPGRAADAEDTELCEE